MSNDYEDKASQILAQDMKELQIKAQKNSNEDELP